MEAVFEVTITQEGEDDLIFNAVELRQLIEEAVAKKDGYGIVNVEVQPA